MADQRAYQTIHTTNQYGGSYDIAPLTTVWTAPAACPTIVDFQATFDNNPCVPPDFESVWYSGGFYSPGICPGGYTAGCTPSYFGFSSRPTETAVQCVPTSYSCDTFHLHAYSMNGGNKVTVPAFQIRWAATDVPNLATTPTLPGATKSGSAGSPTGASPTGISSTGVTSPGVTTPGVTTPGANAPSTSGGSSPGGSSSSGLSTGAVAGIAVGAAALVAIIGALLFFFWRRKNKRAAHMAQTSLENTAFNGGRAELDVGGGVGTSNGPAKVGEYGKTDAWVSQNVQEADNDPASNSQYVYHQQEKQELHGGHVHVPGHQGNPQELGSQYHQSAFPQEVHGTVPAQRYEMPDHQYWGPPQRQHQTR